MAGRFNVENASEEVFEFVCGPCHVDGEVLQAKCYCSNCQDYLCDICLKHHLRPVPMRHHVLLDEKSMPKDKKATASNVKASDTCTEKCPKHSGNIIEYCCQSHDFLGCTKCFISDNHRMCKGVVCIAEATAGLYESREYKTYTGNIEKISNDLTKISSIQHKNDENIKMYSIRAKKEIQSFRKSMNEFLNRLENEMDKQVSQMQESQTSKWISTTKQVEHLDNEIKTIKRTTEQSNKSGQMCNSYINMKSNFNQLKQLEDCMVKINEENKVSEYIFKPDDGLQNIIKDTKTFTSTEDDAGFLNSTPSAIPRQRSAQTQTNTPTQRSAQTQTNTPTQRSAQTQTNTPTQRDAHIPINTPTQRSAQNKTNTPTQRDNSALIQALTQRKNWLQRHYRRSHTDGVKYTDAIKSVKAGRRVVFASLPGYANYKGFPHLPKEECDAYNKFHGYY